MKFLAIDTSDKAFIVVAVNGEREERRTVEGVHSVLLMDEIDGALKSVGLTAADTDFIACVVGPGSFTGLRIGISTVKGLCFALGKSALALTSFDVLAYAETGNTVALVDAGHNNYYACPYTDGVAGEAGFYAEAELLPYLEKTRALSCKPLSLPTRICDRAQGLVSAARGNAGRACESGKLAALYLRKSSAEEKR